MKATLLTLLFSGLLAAQLAHGEDIEPGSWKVETTMTAEGRPPAPATTSYVCLQDVYQMLNSGTNCPRGQVSVSGNHTLVRISCLIRDKGVQMDGAANLTVTRTRVSGTLDLFVGVNGAAPVRTTTIIHAVRVGPCLR